MKKLLTVAAIALLVAGCGPRAGLRTGEIVVLDLEAAIDNPRTFDLTDIADDISFIPLDGSRPEALIGPIIAVGESRSRFYVEDRSDLPVKMFDRDGRFVANRGRIGRGPDEYLGIDGLTADWERDDLYLSAYQGAATNTVMAYGADGNIFARRDSIPRGKMASFGGKFLSFNRPNLPPPDGMYTFMERFSAGLQREATLEIPFRGSSWMTLISTTDGQPANATGSNVSSITSIDMSPVVVSNNGTSLLVRPGRSDTVYHYVEGALEPVMYLDHGSYAYTDEAFGMHSNSRPSEEGRFAVEYIYEGDRYVLVTQRRGTRRLLFDRREDYAGFSAVGPGGDQGLFLGGVAFTPCYIRADRLVGFMQAFDIIDGANDTQNPDLKALATTLKEDSNPVIVVAKLKKVPMFKI